MEVDGLGRPGLGRAGNEGEDSVPECGRSGEECLHEWPAISHPRTNSGSKPGLSLTPSPPQDKQHKGEKNISGCLETLGVTAGMTEVAMGLQF